MEWGHEMGNWGTRLGRNVKLDGYVFIVLMSMDDASPLSLFLSLSSRLPLAFRYIPPFSSLDFQFSIS